MGDNQTHQSKKLEMLGVTDQIEDAKETEEGDYMVRCPRCGFTEEGLTRNKAAAMSNKTGCPECPRPTDDLAADHAEGDVDAEPLTNVGAPLAVSPMN